MRRLHPRPSQPPPEAPRRAPRPAWSCSLYREQRARLTPAGVRVPGLRSGAAVQIRPRMSQEPSGEALYQWFSRAQGIPKLLTVAAGPCYELRDQVLSLNLLEMSWLPGKAGGPGPNPKSSFPNWEDCTLSTPSSLEALQTPQAIQPETPGREGHADGRRVAPLTLPGRPEGRVVVGKLASPQQGPI